MHENCFKCFISLSLSLSLSVPCPDQTESQLQGSILLPSYEIGFCNKSDGVNRKYSFKVCCGNVCVCVCVCAWVYVCVFV